MTQQNKELEQARKLLKEWNVRRAVNEKKGLEYFYKLKELFKPIKTTNNEKDNYYNRFYGFIFRNL